MAGSKIADEIIQEQRREKAFKQKAIRRQCVIDNKKQCDECRYKEICEDKKD